MAGKSIRACDAFVHIFHVIKVVVVMMMASAFGAVCVSAEDPSREDGSSKSLLEDQFTTKIRGQFNRYCVDCHGEEDPEAGVRLDRLTADFQEKELNLWKAISKHLGDGSMPPEESPQPTAQELEDWQRWIDEGMVMAKKRVVPKLGSTRRLTVAQYENTLQQLLGIEDHLTEILPPDAPSKDGFLNNQSTLQLSPRLLEAYLDIAQRALDIAIVDETQVPVIQNFRMDLGRAINQEPCPDSLILGALSMLLRNEDFQVVELVPEKSFEFTPFKMQTHYRFIEGYQGNDTVRGWREFNSIYHAVFACMRGNGGYPKGRPYELVPQGLLLRPAIPSAELFEVESTYGPRANFKISLRELPDKGRFRVRVRAAKYEDGLLLNTGVPFAFDPEMDELSGELHTNPTSVVIPEAGIYQVDLTGQVGERLEAQSEASRLDDGLVGHWDFEKDGLESGQQPAMQATLAGEAKLVDTPWGRGLRVNGTTASAVVPHHDSMNVGQDSFSISAWIRPSELRQGGILCLGGYGYTQGLVFDMPNNQGILRLETAREGRQHNGTVQSAPGMIRPGQWQHVAVVCQRGENGTRLFVNGHQVAQGTIGDADLTNAQANLVLGRIENANLFAGDLDEVRFYSRTLKDSELVALFEQGRTLTQPLPPPAPREVKLQLGDRTFTGTCRNEGFLAVRLPQGEVEISGHYSNNSGPLDFHVTRLSSDAPVAAAFRHFERRSPKVGVHVGLRRDCGSTLNPVGPPQAVESGKFEDYIFEGAISNFPSPDVEKDNVNYLAGIREIGVRSEFTDGRDRPRLLIQSVEFEGPFTESWPPASHAEIFQGKKAEGLTFQEALVLVSDFAVRAFRRPLNSDEQVWLAGVLESTWESETSHLDAIKSTLAVVLTSPQFLFLIEASQSPEGEPLDEWELASKLSYLLWDSAPDQVLLEAAARGDLKSNLSSLVGQMISDDRFDQFAEPFVSQWLRLDKFHVLEVDRKRFPGLTRDVRKSLAREPIETVKYLIQHNRPIRELVASDYVLADEVVANYYGLGAKTDHGFEFVPIQHEQKGLGGVLTQAAILAGLSDGREPNPVKRGAWFARSIIAEPPADPPPNVPALPEGEKENLSLREKLEKHRNQKGCQQCHEGIDPWGLPFEYYDAGGKFRFNTEIEVSSVLPDQTEVKNVEELKAYLIEKRLDQVAFSYLKHMATYAIGRGLTYNEIESIREMVLEFKTSDYPAQEMLKQLIQSAIFLEK
jgi:hypothetical protein